MRDEGESGQGLLNFPSMVRKLVGGCSRCREQAQVETVFSGEEQIYRKGFLPGDEGEDSRTHMTHGLGSHPALEAHELTGTSPRDRYKLNFSVPQQEWASCTDLLT